MCCKRFLVALIFWGALATAGRADVYRWDNNTLIPGTEGIFPGPGVILDHHELAFARLSNYNLTGAMFQASNLTSADLSNSTLTSANLTSANLTNAYLHYSTLTGANLTGAVVAGARFIASTGFTKEQLYSTASYSQQNLQGIGLTYVDFTDGDFSGQNLTGASFNYATLTGTNLTGANFTSASVSDSTLAGANLTGANLSGAALGYSTLTGANLTGANFTSASVSNSNLAGANLTGADLSGAALRYLTLTGANLRDAVITGANFSLNTGFAKAQFYSTANYQQHNLQGMGLAGCDLTDWDFSGQNLTTAYFNQSTLTGANLAGANLTDTILETATLTGANLTGANLTNANLTYSTSDNANFTGANLTNTNFGTSTLTGANFTGAVVAGTRFSHAHLTAQQLYTTASYVQHNLQGIGLNENDLTNWDFHGQNLTSAGLSFGTLTNADLTGAVVTGAQFLASTGLTKEQLYSTASYLQHNLQGIGLSYNDLTNWDFSGQNLTGAGLSSTLTGANFMGANLTNTNLYQAILTNANLTGADLRGADTPDLTGATTHNAILPSGTIDGLDVAAGQKLVVRNYHGDPDRGVGPIPISVQNHMAVASGGVLQTLFDADDWDSTISFQPGMPVDLAGNLELMFATDVILANQVGRTFDVFDWTGVTRSGRFQVASPYAWNLSNLYTSGEVTLTAVVQFPGDADGNQFVDFTDLGLLLNSYNQPGTFASGDFDNSGLVDFTDLGILLNNYNLMAPTLASAVPVPEPSTHALAALGAFGLAIASCRPTRTRVE